MNSRLVFLTVLILVSCSQDKKVLNENEKFLVGYWIPKKIDWLKPNSGDKQIDSIRRYSNFPLLCFSSDQFDLINATNGYTIGDDSLVFESEPGIELFRGTWKANDSLIFIEREFKFSMVNPSGKDSELIKDTIQITRDRLEFIFNGQHFVRADLFDRLSIDKIEAYRVSDSY
jgi:hypothetical protein